MESADGRVAGRKLIRASGERDWRDNRLPLEGEVTLTDRALEWMVAWRSWEVRKMGERGTRDALDWLGTRRAE